MNTIGERIRIARKEKGMSQETLAHSLGIQKATISRYEKNQREPSLEMLLDISEALNVSILYFLGDEDINGFLLPNAFADPGDYEFIKALGLHDPVNRKHLLCNDLELKLKKAFHGLNEKGQKIAVERVEELSKIPDYQIEGELSQIKAETKE